MKLTDYFKQQSNKRTRSSWEALVSDKGNIVEIDKSDIEQACRFFSNLDSFNQVLRKNIERYAFEYIPGNVQDNTLGKYVQPGALREGEVIKFQLGIYENIVTGVGHAICHTLSNLFNSPLQKWQFIKNDKEADEATVIIKDLRETGGFIDRLTQIDYISSGVDSAILHIYAKGERLAYDTVWPSNIRIIYGNTVTDRVSSPRGAVTRGVDITDLEDASAVIIKLSGNTWQAYVGACSDGFPYGRMVTYKQENYWPIPGVNEDSKIIAEYTRDGIGPCNPLSYIAMTSDAGGVEYPFVIIKGTQTYGSLSVLPTSDTFWHNCIEIETAWSSILKQAVQAARGKDVFTLTQAGLDLPASLEVLVCPPGCSYDYVPGNSSGVMAGMQGVTGISRAVAASRGVPPYIIVGHDQLSPEAGVALAIRTAPLIESRQRRINLNKDQIGKIIDIEAGLLMEMFPDAVEIFSDVKQLWTPGDWVIPSSKLELLQEIELELKLGLTNEELALQRLYNIATAQEAKVLFDSIKKTGSKSDVGV
jgi:hypothetical protein